MLIASRDCKQRKTVGSTLLERHKIKQMKKILGLVTGLMMAAFTFGQSTISFSDASDSYDKKATTSFNFTFSPVHSADDITSNAAYYESYFTVSVTPAGTSGNTVNITLVEDNEMARRVIMRLFVNLEINEIGVNGTDMDRNDFMTTYIMVD